MMLNKRAQQELAKVINNTTNMILIRKGEIVVKEIYFSSSESPGFFVSDYEQFEVNFIILFESNNNQTLLEINSKNSSDSKSQESNRWISFLRCWTSNRR